MHHSIIFYHQLDARTACLFTSNTLIKILYIFRAYPFLIVAQDSHLQRVTIPEIAYIKLRREPPEDEQGMLETCRGY